MIRLIVLGVYFASIIPSSVPAAIQLSYTDHQSTSNEEIIKLQLAYAEIVGHFTHKYVESNRQADMCTYCQGIVAVIKSLIRENKTQEEIIEDGTAICSSLGIEDVPVCHTAMMEIIPELTYIANWTGPGYSPANICGFMNGAACVIVDEYLPVFDWNVGISGIEPPYFPLPQPEPNAPKLRILHMSDTHYDPQYIEGGVVNCNEQLCCRAGKVSPSSEVYYSGKYGGLNGSCDIPQITLESMLQYAAENLDFDFVYWTGDIPPHDIWNQTKEGNIQQLHLTAGLIQKYIPATKIVYPSCGNHESEPCNSFPVPPVYQDFNISYLYNELDSVWSTFIPNLKHDTVLKGGYYVVDLRPGLRLISLNMNYGGPGNWWLFVESQDPTEELQWLISQLDDAEQNNIKVHIIGHIPPGKTTYVWSRNYRDIMDRYKMTIAGHFYGHTHNDHFEILFDDVNITNPISVAHIGPSVTTYSNVNPSFRIYIVDGDYNGTSWGVLDYEEYWLDIDRANADGFPTWELLYTAKESYGMNDFSPAEFNNFVNRMKSDDDLFQTFYQHYNREFTRTPCVDDCKSELLCDLTLGWAGYSTECTGG